jgi:hypothetical protein
VNFLRKKLGVREGDGIWCYIDNFAPAPDEGVGGLYNVCSCHHRFTHALYLILIVFQKRRRTQSWLLDNSNIWMTQKDSDSLY